ncbi:hypothetical protein DBB29_10020 [Pandoraea cepalis]|uniref:BrnT family toxin n=1 Tax=Pandoraea cepalis TaxID=2508294 RepID=A0AAW7MHH5_9BURK|nr:hypothetical protein [Pandoraea cepalis]MDN4578449.1 hypothetical protein [Pandoraea cepalis]
MMRAARQRVSCVALGPLGDRLHVMVLTVRDESNRVISLRKANRREVRKYDET